MAGLAFVSLSKAFPGVRALDAVSFGVRAGSVHGLCGENGAGKSTLLKILSGVYAADSGHVEIGGVAHRFGSSGEAIGAGVSVIYQELNLVREVSVAENIFLGHLPAKAGFVDRGELRRRAKESLERVGLDIDPFTKLGRLSLAQQQMVEIAKALSHDATVIAFDEPTSSLSTREVDRLFELIAELRASGKSIIYVSHRMDEILQVCDACTVLRDGVQVETFETMDGVTADMIINRMVGRDIDDVFGYEDHSTETVRMSCRDVTGPGLHGPASLQVRRGEILGVFGLVGSGRTSLMKAIYAGGGTVEIDGAEIRRSGAQASIRAGLVFCPEDRKHEGIFPALSVEENINLSVRRRLARAGVLSRGAERANATKFVEKLKVKTASLATPIQNLSGGNQQKAILARWLSEDVRVMLLDEPTRGIDVGAKSEIYGIMRDLAKQGVAIVMVSSELPEVMGVCSRIIVMSEGKIVGEARRDQMTEAGLLSMALPQGVSA